MVNTNSGKIVTSKFMYYMSVFAVFLRDKNGIPETWVIGRFGLLSTIFLSLHPRDLSDSETDYDLFRSAGNESRIGETMRESGQGLLVQTAVGSAVEIVDSLTSLET